MSGDGVVIVGGGQAASQLAASLRENGYDRAITILAGEPTLPYQRPPLSKAFLKGATTVDNLLLRTAAFYSANAIDVLLGERAVAIDRRARKVELASQRAISYRHLVFATGSRNRRLSVPGADLDGVLDLRSLADAQVLKSRLAQASRVAVIGAGFVGLELACVMHDLGAAVTVIEAAQRAMARALSPQMSNWLAAAHADAGIDVRLGVTVAGLGGADGRVCQVDLVDGPPVAADLVLVGIGAVPDRELASRCGLATSDGIAVDGYLTTADPAIHAIGDCALVMDAVTGRRLRLESVQNAVDHARCLAATLSGRPTVCDSVPWFWSDQGRHRLQIAGLTGGHDRAVVRGDVAGGRFSIFCYAGRRLLGVESINQAADHMVARRLLAAGGNLSPEQAADPSFDLKSHVLAAENGEQRRRISVA